MSAVLGLLLDVALYAVVRCKVLVEGSLHSSFARELMMGFGLLSVVVAALLLSRQKDIKRLFVFVGVEHMGVIHFRLRHRRPGGRLRGTAAHDRPFARPSPPYSSPSVTQREKPSTQMMAEEFGRLITSARCWAGARAQEALAILGMPPFGVFASES